MVGFPKDFPLPSDTDDFAELLRSWWQDVEQTGRIRKCEKLLSGADQCWALCTCMRKCTQTWKFYTEAPAPEADHVKFVWQTSGPHVPQPEDARSKANANRVAHLNPLAGAAQLIREGVPPAEMPDHHDLPDGGSCRKMKVRAPACYRNGCSMWKRANRLQTLLPASFASIN